MQSLPASERALAAADGQVHKGFLTVWTVPTHGKSGRLKQSVTKIALGPEGGRAAALESLPLDQLHPLPANSIPQLDRPSLETALTTDIPQALHRDLEYRGELAEGAWYSSRLIALLLL